MKIRSLFLLSLFLLSSCKGGASSSFNEVKDNCNPSFTYEENNEKALELDIEDREMYENKFLDDRIANQWPSYGIGDPFIYRFNGKYYLYCSTKDNYVGVKAWVSEDLMNWELVKAEGLEEGFVCIDDTTVSAYAPEVIYRDGYFYMCQSSAGNGHYLYKSEKPEGPFVRISDNIQESIDGSFFIDDDEEMYFLRASDNGIVIKKFNDNFEFVDDKVIDASYMNGWTEGPYLLKRDDMYYLTYTGNHIMSNAYRVSYSYATEDEFNNNYSFNKGNVLLLNTDEDFKGLGHSSTVMGPDLDSYYVAYHNLINTIPTRNFNLARLSFNGANMSVDSCSIENNFVPRLPKFSSENKEGLNKEGNKYLNDVISSDIYSAEYNFIGDNVNLYFSYVDDNNFNYINLLNNKISVYQVENNKETLLKSITLNREYDYSKLHTIRIAYNKTLDIYFDNCRKINDLEIKNNNGYIGYSDNVDIYYTALSDVAKFSSDSKEIHQNNISLEDYIYSNTDIKFGEGMYKNSKSVVLENKGDRVAYKIYLDEDYNYSFDLLYKKEFSGKKIKIRIDNKDNIIATLPSVKDVDNEFVKTTIFNEYLQKGFHTLSITCIDKVEIMELSINKVNKDYSTYSYSLVCEENLTYITNWTINDKGHIAKAADRNIAYVPLENIENAIIEVDVELLVSTTMDASIGVVLRADNAGLYTTEDQTGIQGYFCGINSFSVFISKYNYEYSLKDVSKEKTAVFNNKSYHLKATIKGNNIVFDFNDGAIILEYNDPIKISSGNFGIYADNATAVFKNLKVTPIEY